MQFERALFSGTIDLEKLKFIYSQKVQKSTDLQNNLVFTFYLRRTLFITFAYSTAIFSVLSTESHVNLLCSGSQMWNVHLQQKMEILFLIKLRKKTQHKN